MVQEFDYTWYCRVVSPHPEEYKHVDKEGFPFDDMYDGQSIPPSKKDKGIGGLGCFGKGPGQLSSKEGFITINTMSFVNFGKVYEITLVLKKDTRRSKVILELELGQIPEPIMEVKCLSDELCFPGPNGVFVNPTSRLAIVGECIDKCGDMMKFEWTLVGPHNKTLNLVMSIPYKVWIIHAID